jgi:flagellar motor protein MotB
MRVFAGAVLLSVSAVTFYAWADAPVGGLSPVRAQQLEERDLPPLKVEIDRAKVDLDARRLEVRMSREPSKVRIKVIGETGSVLTEEEHDFSGERAGKALIVRWKRTGDEKVARIEVFGYDTHGYYAGVAITPWSVSIPHEEVNFETASHTIRRSETPKLEESFKKVTEALGKHKELGNISLFIAGHTDTVGTPTYNQDLSRRRARSIAAWFRKRGLRIAVYYEGFGESALAVKTEDEVDEARNRRADYILSIESPRFKKQGTTPAWKKI